MHERKNPVLVIMAAGMGSRYGGLKQMDPMDEFGHLIIDYSIYDAVQAGFEEVIFVIKEENKQLFQETIGDRISKKIKVTYAFQRIMDLPAGFEVPEGRVKPWGTGHAILSCYFAANGRPFAVINADDYYGRDAFCRMYEYLAEHEDTADKYSYAMVGYQLKNTVTENGSVSRGVCQVNEDNKLISVQERTRIEKVNGGIAYTEDGENWISLPEDTVVSMNMWGFTYSIMNELVVRFGTFLEKALKENPLKGEFFLPFVVEELLQENKAVVEVMTTPDKWYGVTYKEDKETVVAALKSMRESGFYPDQLLDA